MNRLMSWNEAIEQAVLIDFFHLRKSRKYLKGNMRIYVINKI